MSQYNHYLGIDISKDFFDVVDDQGCHYQFVNVPSGFKELLKIIQDNPVCVMEATGVYHVSLAMFLHELNIPVVVLNPLQVKRFIQMNLKRDKTDKADAQMICKYALNQPLPLWNPPARVLQEAKGIQDSLQLITKQRTMTKNRLHSLESQPVCNKVLLRKLKQQVNQMHKLVEELEQEIESLLKVEYQQTLTQLTSIPGIGIKTAIQLVLLTEGFSKFETARQFSSFVGLAPVQRTSGISVRGKSSISKKGHSSIRNLLFMCAFNACKCNRGCRLLYERLVAKGKSKKLALIAVANKLIKQVFGLINNDLIYDENFVSKLSVK